MLNVSPQLFRLIQFHPFGIEEEQFARISTIMLSLRDWALSLVFVFFDGIGSATKSGIKGTETEKDGEQDYEVNEPENYC